MHTLNSSTQPCSPSAHYLKLAVIVCGMCSAGSHLHQVCLLAALTYSRSLEASLLRCLLFQLPAQGQGPDPTGDGRERLALTEHPFQRAAAGVYPAHRPVFPMAPDRAPGVHWRHPAARGVRLTPLRVPLWVHYTMLRLWSACGQHGSWDHGRGWWCEQVQMRQEQDDVAFRVLARGEGAHVAQDEAALHDYFNLGTSLAELSLQWAQGDARFRKICPYYPGAPWTLSPRATCGATVFPST